MVPGAVGGRALGLGRVVTWSGRVILGIALLAALALTVGTRLLPYKTFAVLSGSMQPSLPVGSLVISVPVHADRLKVGDVITFRRPDQEHSLVTHRIARIEERRGLTFFVTKGDANGAVDGWLVPATGSGLREVFRIPFLGYPLGATQGRLLLLSLSATVLCGVALMQIWRPRPVAVP